MAIPSSPKRYAVMLFSWEKGKQQEIWHKLKKELEFRKKAIRNDESAQIIREIAEKLGAKRQNNSNNGRAIQSPAHPPLQIGLVSRPCGVKVRVPPHGAKNRVCSWIKISFSSGHGDDKF